MKKLIIGGLIGLCSLAASSKEYSCKSYSMYSRTPIQDAVNFTININETINTGSIAVENGHTETGRVYQNGSLITLDVGEGDGRTQFNIETNPNVDILAEYIEKISANFGMSEADKKIFETELRKMFKDTNINGTQLVLLNVSSMLDCKEKTTDN